MPQDHVITAQDEFPRTAIARWEANVAAIQVVKKLEAAKRPATAAEQKALGQYSGFGDSAYEQAFKYAHDPAWKRRKEELEALVTPGELEGIRRSRINAFYTTPAVVRSMWSTLEKMGADKLKKPKVLEPSAGSGRFLGLQPKGMAVRSERTAVELDPMTADILKHLYPKTKVYAAGFQEAPTPDNHFDIAISNVPFGDVKVYDKEFNATGRKYLTNSVHNYFFAKTLDKLRPGGVMAYVTSHHTMDAPSAEPVRRYLADQADLVGAVRLPEDAFPDTQVVTDIMYLRKRAEGEKPGDDSWVESEPAEIAKSYYGDPITEHVNRYYVDNPDKVLGRHSDQGGMYRGGSYTVKSDPGRPLSKRLEQESGEVARNGGDLAAPVAMATAKPVRAVAAGPAKYVVQDGDLQVDQDGKTSAHELSSVDAKRVTALVGMRDTARELVEQEGQEADHDAVERTRASLRGLYDDYVDQYGEAINTPANRKLLGGAADDHLLFALERYDKETECWQPSDIMNKRVVGAVPIQKVSSAGDAMTASLNESGKLDFERMGKMLGRSADEVREELEDEQLVFRSPAGDAWMPNAEYLSGNVREKLKAARLAATADPSYKKHIEALEQVQPVPVTAEEIATPLGAPWIPAPVVNEWVQDTFQPYNKSYYGEPTQYFRYGEMGESFVAGGKRVGGSGVGGGWTDMAKINASDAVMKNQWGTEKLPAHRILLKTLQGAPVEVKKKLDDGKSVQDQEATIAAQEKAAAMQKSFKDWIWKDPERRERLEGLYNDTHNGMAPRVFDGSHQTFPGMALQWQQQMRPHQRDAIFRTVHDGTTLLAHEVGFGKTATMIASAMERKRIGLANKPVFVVPKATHEQFIGQFMEVYPGARVLAPDASDFEKGNREAFLSRIATGDWDGVILTTEHFEKIPLSPETEAKWIQLQKAEMMGALMEVETDSAAGKRTQKQIQKKIENYSVRLLELRDRMRDRSDDSQTFESLGIDQIYVDEADRYKNLPYVTNKGNVKGLPQTSSQRAWDMYMKIRYLQEKAGEKPDGSFAKGGVVFATGTPVANTIAETYTMMRYLQPTELKRQGLASFDAWAKTYGEETIGIEQTASGTYRPVQRFAKFVNLPELSMLFQNVADIRVASEVPEMQAAQPRLVDKQGENKRITVVSPSHTALEDYMDAIVKRVKNLQKVDPSEDNMLKISSDARKAALDVRMVEPSAPHNPQGKVGMAAENIAEIFKKETPDKGTQLVFLDMGTPKATEGKDDESPTDEALTGEEKSVLTNVYRNLKNELTGRGVPEDQIAFIHDYKSPAAREELLDRVRRGETRVLVGSTEKIGVGVNVQDRAAAAHHIDVPWRPRDVEQREGRIIRQGNEVYGPVLDPETRTRLSPGRGVQIFQYVQEGSFDGFMWQAVEAKARAIKSLMKRKQTERGMDDIDPFILGVAEAKALASGNPLVFRAEELKQKVVRGRQGQAAHRRQLHEAETQKRSLQGQAERYRSELPALQADAKHVKNLPPGDFEATIGGKDFAKRPEAAKALEAALKRVKYDPRAGAFTLLGSFKGLEVGGVNADQGYQIVVRHPETKQPYGSGYVDADDFTAAGLMTRLDNLVKGIPKRAERISGNLQEAEDSLRIYDEQIGKQFGGVAELTHSEKQLRVIQARLADNPGSLPPDYDYKMDVMSDWDPSTAPAPEAAVDTPREAPDADAIDLREAVEAVRPGTAETTAEVTEVLVDELQDSQDSPGGLDSEPDNATAEQIARIKALAEILPGRFAARMVREAQDMGREDARTAIEELQEIIEDTGTPEKLRALKALDAPAPDPEPQPETPEPKPVADKKQPQPESDDPLEAQEPDEPEPAAEPLSQAQADKEQESRYRQLMGLAEQSKPDEPSKEQETDLPEPVPWTVRQERNRQYYERKAEELRQKREAAEREQSQTDQAESEPEPSKFAALQDTFAARRRLTEPEPESVAMATDQPEEGAPEPKPEPKASEPEREIAEHQEEAKPNREAVDRAEEEIEEARDDYFDNVPGSGRKLDDAVRRADDLEVAAKKEPEPRAEVDVKRTPKQDLDRNLTRLRRIDESDFPPGEKARIVATWGKAAEAAAEPAPPEPEATPEPVKPKRKREAKAKAKALPASKVVLDGEPFYQGHKGPGIGYLKPDLPERRDGDGDTVVAERRPRKSDEFKRSPLPAPRLTGKYAKLAAVALSKTASKRRTARRHSRSSDGLKNPSWGAPSIKIITR